MGTSSPSPIGRGQHFIGMFARGCIRRIGVIILARELNGGHGVPALRNYGFETEIENWFARVFSGCWRDAFYNLRQLYWAFSGNTNLVGSTVLLGYWIHFCRANRAYFRNPRDLGF